MTPMRLEALVLAAGLSAMASAGAAAPCRHIEVEGIGHAVCEVTASDDVRLWQTAPDGTPYGSFARIKAILSADRLTLGFAMNAGMYHPGRAPVGLFIGERGEEAAIVTAAGPGNFGLLPNGVFCIGASGFAVIESRRFDADRPACRFATQSGPMLVIDGALHPRFLAASDSTYVRNGVGVSGDGSRAVFVISDRPVTFHAFARVFRDTLGLPNALYLDGSISRLYAPDLGRDDIGLPMGPIVGLVVPEK